MNRIKNAFQDQKAFIAFLTAGDPTQEKTVEYILEMEKAILIDGVDVIGYTPWGCIDLVSASTGEMAKRYGFIFVERYDDGTGDFSRRRKESFYWYQKVIASDGEDLR